jgi:hypothetical protein
MADLEKTLAQRFQERKRQVARLAEANAPLRDKLIGPLGKDRSWAASIRWQRRAMRKSLASSRLSISKALPRKAGARVFVGSNGAARFVPFDYSWTRSYLHGADAPDLRADADSGNMHVNVDTHIWLGGLEAYAAVGVFFRLPSPHFFTVPIFPLANFTVFANPSVQFAWEAFLAPELWPGHSGGFVGLLAQRYDWTQGLASPLSTATLLSQEIPLWDDDSLGLDGSGWNNRPWVSVPLSASFLVDPGPWYALWVWCGTHDWAYGPYDPNGNWAMSGLRVNVPSISWQFGPLQALPALP